MIQVLFFSYFFLAGITWVSGEAGVGISGRVTFADIIGMLIVVAATIYAIRTEAVKVPAVYRSYLPLLFIFFVGIAFSHDPRSGMLEWVIHAYIFSTAVAMHNLAVGNPYVNPGLLFKSLLFAGAALALVGLLQFFLFPGWFAGAPGGLSGTFRNTGQAGAFFGVFLALLVPAFVVGIIPPRTVNIVAILLVLMALVFTFKRAAMLGFFVGGLLLLALLYGSRRISEKKTGLLVTGLLAIFAPIVTFAFTWGLDNVVSMAWRFSSKFNNSVPESFAHGFLSENVDAAITAFQMNPWVGVGLGNVGMGFITDKYEIHSTYLAILGLSGITGVAAYLLFMGTLLTTIVRAPVTNIYGRYLRYFFPMFIGLIISWAYTYHLRKREFWILVFFCVMCTKLARVHGSRSDSRAMLGGGRADG